MSISRFAFFDVDETLIELKSMFSFRAYYFRWLWGESRGGVEEDRVAQEIRDQVEKGADRSSINRLFYRIFMGHRQQDFRAAAHAWHQHVRSRPDFFVAPVLSELRKHQTNGTDVVFVSGSCTEILAPLADELQVKYMLANRMCVVDGCFTGEILSPQTIGEGKRVAINAFLADGDFDPAECFGYGDHLSDLPLLEAVGRPSVVARSEELLAIARQRGWPILNPTNIQ